MSLQWILSKWSLQLNLLNVRNDGEEKAVELVPNEQVEGCDGQFHFHCQGL